MKPVRE